MADHQPTAPIEPDGPNALNHNTSLIAQARVIGDLLDKHPELGKVCSFSVDAQWPAVVHVSHSHPAPAEALLAWFGLLDDAALSRTAYPDGTQVYVSGTLDGGAVQVRAFFAFKTQDARKRLSGDKVTVATLRALQADGAR